MNRERGNKLVTWMGLKAVFVQPSSPLLYPQVVCLARMLVYFGFYNFTKLLNLARVLLDGLCPAGIPETGLNRGPLMGLGICKYALLPCFLTCHRLLVILQLAYACLRICCQSTHRVCLVQPVLQDSLLTYTL